MPGDGKYYYVIQDYKGNPGDYLLKDEFDSLPKAEKEFESLKAPDEWRNDWADHFVYIEEVIIKDGDVVDRKEIKSKSFGHYESSAEELMDIARKELPSLVLGDFDVDGGTYQITSRLGAWGAFDKYNELVISNEDGESLGYIELRIADHSYNPKNNTSKDHKGFISVVIANEDQTKDRFGGRYNIRFGGDDKIEDIANEVKWRIKEILEELDSEPYSSGGAVQNKNKNHFMNEARIYVADLAAYNNGKLVGEWLSLNDYTSANEFFSAVDDLMDEWSDERGEKVEEFAFHDFENLPDSFHEEYLSQDELQKYYDAKEVADDLSIPVEVVLEWMDDTGADEPDGARHAYNGLYDDMEGFAESLVDEGVISDLSSYLYMTDTDRRILANEEAEYNVGEMDDDEVITEAGLDDELAELERERDEDENFDFDSAYESLVDKAREKARDEMYYHIFEKTESPVDYFVWEQGIYSESDLAKQNFIRIDYEKLARDLSYDYTEIRYDGESYIFSDHYAKGGKVKRTKRAIEADKRIRAKKPGRRVSEAGNVYYESRPNRSDVDRKKKFEKGGSTGEPELIFSGHYGIYIPKMFAKKFDLSNFGFNKREAESLKRDLSSPDNEFYWDAWQDVLDGAVTLDGWTLHQDDDLWLVPPGYEGFDGYKRGGRIKRTKRAIEADKRIRAKKPGRRVSEAGNVYYENRPNRSDVDRKKRFEDGGGVGNGKPGIRKVFNEFVNKFYRKMDYWSDPPVRTAGGTFIVDLQVTDKNDVDEITEYLKKKGLVVVGSQFNPKRMRAYFKEENFRYPSKR